MNQAAFGPAGKEVLSMIHQMQNDSVSFKSIITISALLWHVEEITKKIEARTNARALEADDLMGILLHESKTCELNQWNKRCALLKNEIDIWIEKGALQ